MFIDEQRVRFGVEPICEALGVSASAYYQRAGGERSARRVEDERLLELIGRIHERNYFAYGCWRMWKALGRAGEQVGRGRVERLMRANGIQGAKRRGKPWRTTFPDREACRPADLVQRDFSASRPDETWFVDFTYLRCWEGVVFFAFVIDAYSRMVVAGSSPSTCAPTSCSTRCGWRSPNAHPVPTSDSYTTATPAANTARTTTARPSTTTACSPRSARSATRTTLATAESFVDSFKTELIRDRVWRSRSQLELAIVEYVAWFNNERLHTSLGGVPPAEFEADHSRL